MGIETEIMNMNVNVAVYLSLRHRTAHAKIENGRCDACKTGGPTTDHVIIWACPATAHNCKLDVMEQDILDIAPAAYSEITKVKSENTDAATDYLLGGGANCKDHQSRVWRRVQQTAIAHIPRNPRISHPSEAPNKQQEKFKERNN